jgi:hypothetical protein
MLHCTGATLHATHRSIGVPIKALRREPLALPSAGFRARTRAEAAATSNLLPLRIIDDTRNGSARAARRLLVRINEGADHLTIVEDGFDEALISFLYHLDA